GQGVHRVRLGQVGERLGGGGPQEDRARQGGLLPPVRGGERPRRDRKVTDDYISRRVKFEVLEYRIKVTESEIRELERSEREVRGELDAMKPDLEKAGERIMTQRAPYEVSEELKLVSAQLQKLQDLPDDAEKIYRDYPGNLEGLKGKLQELQDNK